jgi:hypothetical protein
MLVELRDVEVFIEPQDILSKALQEGDLTVDQAIYECVSEEGVERVLDAIDNDDIRGYVERYDLDLELDTFAQVARAVSTFSQEDKAKLLWLLLKCQEV